MKTRILMMIAVCALTGCSSLSKVAVVTHATHDTIYVNTVRYDSVYLFQSQQTDRQNDTVVIHDLMREYKYRLLHDTIRMSRVDSVPVIHKVEVVKQERYVPAIYRWSLGITIIIVLLIIIYIVWKIAF